MPPLTFAGAAGHATQSEMRTEQRPVPAPSRSDAVFAWCQYG